MLSCGCDYGYYDWYYIEPKDFTILDTKRRRRCYSCGELININSDCVEFERHRDAHNEIEEEIYGCEVPLASKYMCFDCGSIFLNLSAIGYCVEIGGHMKDELMDYWDITGFKLKERRQN